MELKTPRQPSAQAATQQEVQAEIRKIPAAGSTKYSEEQLRKAFGSLERLVDEAAAAENAGKPPKEKLCIGAVGDSGVNHGTLEIYVWGQAGRERLPNKFRKWAARIRGKYEKINKRVEGSFKFTHGQFENAVSQLEKRVEALRKSGTDNKPHFLNICREVAALPEVGMGGFTLCRYITAASQKARFPEDLRQRAARVHNDYMRIEKRYSHPISQKYTSEQFGKAVNYLDRRIGRLEKEMRAPLPSFTALCKGAEKASGVGWKTISEYMRAATHRKFLPGSLQERGAGLYERYLELGRKIREKALNHVEGRLLEIKEKHLPLESMGVICNEASALTGIGERTIREGYIRDLRRGRGALPTAGLRRQAGRILKLCKSLEKERWDEAFTCIEKQMDEIEAKKLPLPSLPHLCKEAEEASAIRKRAVHYHIYYSSGRKDLPAINLQRRAGGILKRYNELAAESGLTGQIRIGRHDVPIGFILRPVWVNFQLNDEEKAELVRLVETMPRYGAAKVKLRGERWWAELKEKCGKEKTDAASFPAREL